MRSDMNVDDAQKETKAEEILRVAEMLFAEFGFAGVSLDMIAARVGIRRPSVLHHFRSKREIYDLVEKRMFDALLRRGGERMAPGPPFERFMALLDTWLDFMVERPSAARIVLRNSADLESRAPDPVEFSGSVVDRFDRLVAEGVESGDFRRVDPALLLHIVAGAIPQYVCNASQLGSGRNYDFTDPALLLEFRAMLRRAAGALLLA